MLELVDSISAALSAGTNPVTAMRDAFGYSLEELAVTSGLATSELVELENGDADPAKLARLASALGLPDNLIS